MAHASARRGPVGQVFLHPRDMPENSPIRKNFIKLPEKELTNAFSKLTVRLDTDPKQERSRHA
jgi:hypothetical protein